MRGSLETCATGGVAAYRLCYAALSPASDLLPAAPGFLLSFGIKSRHPPVRCD